MSKLGEVYERWRPVTPVTAHCETIMEMKHKLAEARVDISWLITEVERQRDARDAAVRNERQTRAVLKGESNKLTKARAEVKRLQKGRDGV